MLSDGSNQAAYRVNTPVYEGPLDLLLSLIEKAELDITRLALAQVTDQYLTYIQNMEAVRAADISEFLVIAAKLIQIKSAALLPKPRATTFAGIPSSPSRPEKRPDIARNGERSADNGRQYRG